MEIDRVIKAIFPPFNELTVFVIAVTIYFIPLHELLASPNAVEQVVMSAKKLYLTSTKSVGDFATMMFGLSVAAVFIIGPLVMPFTKIDLRLTSLFIVALFSLVTLVMSIKGYNKHDLFSGLILLYSIGWTAYMVLSLAFINELNDLVSDEQTSPLVACLVAAVSVCIMYVLKTFYSINQDNAVIVGVAISTSIAPLVLRLFDMIRGSPQFLGGKNET